MSSARIISIFGVSAEPARRVTNGISSSWRSSSSSVSLRHSAGSAVQSRKFVTAAQKLPLEHPLELGGGAGAGCQRVQQAVEIDHGNLLSASVKFWQEDRANIWRVNGHPTASS